MSAFKDIVKQKISTFLKVPLNRIDDSMRLKGIVPDSFMMVELLIELQEEYSVRLMQEDVENIDTVSDLVNLIAARAKSVEAVAE